MKIRNGLPNFLEKLKNREPVQMGFLGGSITLAEGYRPQIVKWLQDKYPGSKITHINAGIGGTGSVLGVCRIDEDILKYNPDFLFVEFAVNDCEHTSSKQCSLAMEGIVRKIRQNNPYTDICFLYTINSQIREALFAEKLYWTVETMEMLAEHYGIPSINLGPEIVCMEKKGKLIYRVEQGSEEEKKAHEADKLVFCYDGVHPTLDDGHGLYTQIISECMDCMDTIGLLGPHELPDALTKNPWVNAKLLPISKADLSHHWKIANTKTEGLRCANLHRLLPLYKADLPGASINFKFQGTGFGLFCIFGLNCGQLKISIDGHEQEKVPLIDKYGNNYRVHYQMIATDLEDCEHDIVLELDSEFPDKNIIKRPIDDLKKLEGLVCYIGSLLIIGKMK